MKGGNRTSSNLIAEDPYALIKRRVCKSENSQFHTLATSAGPSPFRLSRLAAAGRGQPSIRGLQLPAICTTSSVYAILSVCVTRSACRCAYYERAAGAARKAGKRDETVRGEARKRRKDELRT